VRRELTDTLKAWVDEKDDGSSRFPRYVYVNVSKLIYRSVFSNYTGKPGMPDDARNKMTEHELDRVVRMELLCQERLAVIRQQQPELDIKQQYRLLADDMLEWAEKLGRIECHLLPAKGKESA